MRRFRNLLAVCALALPIPAAIAGCGGDSGSDVDPQTVLDDTFNNDQKVSSGDLSLSFNGSADGAAGGSFEASLEGPFQGDPDNPNAIPQLDFTGKVDYSAAGRLPLFRSTRYQEVLSFLRGRLWSDNFRIVASMTLKPGS